MKEQEEGKKWQPLKRRITRVKIKKYFECGPEFFELKVAPDMWNHAHNDDEKWEKVRREVWRLGRMGKSRSIIIGPARTANVCFTFTKRRISFAEAKRLNLQWAHPWMMSTRKTSTPLDDQEIPGCSVHIRVDGHDGIPTIE